jgi:sensor histidine kinase regulating citrate/malate metabolism
MRTALVIIALAALGYFFVVQKQTEPSRNATAAAASTPRQVYEHDWARHALDTTAKVKQKVARQRAENAQP